MRTLPRGDLRAIAAIAIVLAVAPIPVVESSYYLGVLSHLAIFALLAVALNIVFGQTDQLFLFMGGLAGIGAYGTALLADWTGVTAWITLLVAALFAGLIGLLVSWVSARRNFTVVLISILTLNLQLVFTESFLGARNITNGSTGFPYRYFSLSTVADAIGVDDKVVLFYVVLVFLVASLLLYVWLTNSRFGVAFNAIREDELAAASIGVDVVRYKVIAGFIAAFILGLTGAFYTQEASYITPAVFSFLAVDVTVLIILIVGGLRTTTGPVVGAAIVVVVEQLLTTYLTDLRTAIFGLLLILLFLYFRSGVVRWLESLLARVELGSGGGPADDPG